MRKWRVLGPFVYGLALLLVQAGLALADELGGKIRGTVSDPSGAVIAGAQVTATNVDTGIAKQVSTAPDGGYEFLQLQAPATYNLSVQQTGFKTFQAAGVHLGLNQVYVLNVTLELGQVTQQVTVEARPAQVESTNMQLGAEISGSAIVDLPLNGRDWITLQQTLPGVVASMGDFPDNFATNGARAQSNGYLINGIDANDLPLNTPLEIPSPDAIAEVRMVTNTINPEYGRNSGAILNAVTKSGTNKFHGSAFEFYRDPFLNARNFFLPKPDQFHQNQFGGTVGGPIWKNRTFFFFSYQGTRNRQPVLAGRGFAGGTTPVFTAGQRNGNFPDIPTNTPTLATPLLSPFPLVGENGTTYPANTPYSTIFPTGSIPAVDFNPISLNLIKFMPPPNFGANEFSWNPISRNRDDQYITRIDHTFNSKDSIFGYWLIEPAKTLRDESFSGGSLPGFGQRDISHIQHYTLSWNHTFGSNALNDLRVGYNRLNFVSTDPISPVQPSSVGFTGINPQDPAGAGITSVQILGFYPPAGQSTFGFSYNGPQPRIDQTYQVTENFSKIVGRHTMKFGFEMRRAQVENPFFFVNNGYFGFFASGPFTTGDAGADFLLGIPDSYFQSSGGFIDARTREYYSYAQDQFKIRPNLTLTYGLGWEIDTPLTDIFNHSVALNAFRPGQQSTVFPTAPTGLVFPGDKGISASTYHTRWSQLGPRAGFAWSPGGSSRWSVHGGAGIYYSVPEEELTLNNLQAPPFSLTDFGIGDILGAPSFAAPFTDIRGASAPTPSIPNKYPFTPPAAGSNVDFTFYEPFTLNVMDPNFQVSSSYNYNLIVERELPGAMILTVGYVGLQARHLVTRYELNPAGRAPGVNPTCAATPGCGPTNLGAFVPQTFRYPQTNTFGSLIYGSIGQQATDANSNYNSFQTTLTKRLSHGLNFRAIYVWSHSLDPISSFEDVGGNGEPNPFNPRSNYGDSSFDARHRFVFSYAYELPSVRRFNAFQGVPSRLTDGWRIAGATTFQTGFPIGLIDSSDNSFICYSLVTKYGCPDRPNVLGPVKIVNPRSSSLVNATQGGTTAQDHYYFNPNSFSPESPGVLGDAGRNFFHGPGINNFDFALFKDTKVTENTKIELRFEFFNFFNHVQFNSPVGDVNDPNFGRVLSANPPRIIQLAAKFYF
jgi:carboxypeptidase family protein